MRDKSEMRIKRMKEEQYRVPVFPIDVPPPPPPPDFLAGKEVGYDVDVMWEVDGILGHEHGLELESINDTKSLITSCLPFQVSQHPKTRSEDDHCYSYSDLLLKTETTTSSIFYNYGEEEEEDDDDDGIRSWVSSSSSTLKLSLNYEKVLDAWSDRGSLWACNTTTASAAAATCYMGEVPVLMEGGDEKRCRRREASVLRYKEKRHSRLFSKKIRYQVRKLNADQRPRFKGRFVKRSLEKKIFI